MHTRLRVVGAILFSADHGSRNHQRGAQHPLDAKKVKPPRRAAKQGDGTAHQRPACSDSGVNPSVRSPEVSNPQEMVRLRNL
jgi:hypothetical protein